MGASGIDTSNIKKQKVATAGNLENVNKLNGEITVLDTATQRYRYTLSILVKKKTSFVLHIAEIRTS